MVSVDAPDWERERLLEGASIGKRARRKGKQDERGKQTDSPSYSFGADRK